MLLKAMEQYLLKVNNKRVLPLLLVKYQIFYFCMENICFVENYKENIKSNKLQKIKLLYEIQIRQQRVQFHKLL